MNKLRLLMLLLAAAPFLGGCLIPSRAVANYRFRGQVVDGKGDPIPSADVRVEIARNYESQGDPIVKLAGQQREQRFSTTTDKNGAFSIEGKAVHFVNYNVVGILLFAVIGPVVAWTTDFETKEDVRHAMPSWLGWTLTIPSGIPHASYTTLKIYQLGKPQLSTPLKYEHYMGEKRMLVGDKPVYFKDYEFGQVVIGPKLRVEPAAGPLKGPSSKPLPPPPPRPAVKLPQIKDPVKTYDPSIKQKGGDALRGTEVEGEMLVPVPKAPEEPPAIPITPLLGDPTIR